MSRLLWFVLLLPALGNAQPALPPFDPAPFLIDTTIVPLPVNCPQTTPRAAFDGTNYLMVWSGPWHGSTDSIVGTRLTQSGSILDAGGIRLGIGTAPGVAFGAGNYLVVWEQDSAIRCARVTLAGAVIDTPLTVSGVHGAAPAVTFDGIDYLVTWGGQDLYAARVSPAGAVLDPGGILVSGASGVQEFPAVASDGANCLVTWQDARPGGYYDIYGARITPQGSVLDPGGIAISTAAFSQSSPAIAFDGTNYLVAWQDYRTTDFDIYAGRVTPAGAVLDPDGLPIATSAIYQRYPSLAYGQGSYLVTWERWDGANNQGIWGARIQTSGVPRDSGFCIAPGVGSFAPAVSGGSGYLVAWEKSGIWANWVDTSGAVRYPTDAPVYAAANNQRQPGAAFNGTHYLVVWQDERAGDTADIRGIRVSRFGTQVDPRPITISAAQKVQGNPAAASNGTDFLAVWADLRSDTTRVYAARVSQNGVVLDTAGIRVCSSSGSQLAPVVAGNGSNYLVAWTDGRGSPGRIYAARVTSAGTVLDPQGFPVCSNAAGEQLPGVSSDGTNWLAVWTDSRAGSAIFGARIDADGHVLDSSGFPVSPGLTSESYPAVAWCGDRYAVVWWRAPRAINGAFVSASGAVLDTTGAIGSGRFPAVAFDGTNAAVAWENSTGRDIYGATVSLTGTRLDSFALAATSATEYGPELAAGGSGRVLAVYSARVDTAAGRPWYCRRIVGDRTAFGGVSAGSPVVPPSPLAVFPNPFKSNIFISLGHLTAGPLDHLSLRIYDAQGRLIRALHPSPRAPSPTYLSWDATDSRGLPVPPGIYFVTVTSGSMTATHPVTHVRN
jgi:hypothetical protein